MKVKELLKVLEGKDEFDIYPNISVKDLIDILKCTPTDSRLMDLIKSIKEENES